MSTIAQHPVTDGGRPDKLELDRATERYVQSKIPTLSSSSITAYTYRLKTFTDWARENNTTTTDDLDGWTFESYKQAMANRGVASTTLQNRIKTLKQFIEYLARIELVDDDLPHRIEIPAVPDAEKSNEERLAHEDAFLIIDYHRNSPDVYGSRAHAWFELAWHTGARQGAIRALDTRDLHLDPNKSTGPYVEFVHRPKSDTPLKNGLDGERPVGIPRQVADVLEWYIEHHRHELHDEHGREPLFTTTQGRPSINTPRQWAYEITQPCIHSPCPHGRNPETCEYREHQKWSQCPSSRSPHKIRTGSITWQRDLGFPPEVVAARVNATISVIEEYYDKQTQLDRLETRRREYVDRMTTHKE